MKLSPSIITIILLLFPPTVSAFHSSATACRLSSRQFTQATYSQHEGSSDHDVAVDNGNPKATESLLKSPPEGDQSSTTARLAQNQDNKDNDKLSDLFLPDPKDSNAKAFLEKLTAEEKMKLQSIMSEIHTTRKQRDFDTSDKLTMQLRRTFGVRLYHGNPSFWTTQKGAAPDSYVRAKQDKSQQTLQDMYGPKGHPYKQIFGRDDDNPTSCSPLTTPQIQDLLKQKTLALQQGQVETANAVRFELLINGVEVNEETQEWRRTDGRDSSPAWGSESSSILVDSENTDDLVIPSYTRTNNKSSSADILDDQTQVRIEQLVKDRAVAVARNEIRLVQFLSLELQSTYGIELDDDRHVWSIQPNSSEDQAATLDLLDFPPVVDAVENDDEHSPLIELVPPLLCTSTVSTKSKEQQRLLYRQSSYSRDISNDALMRRIDFLIQERVRKREQGKFREADAIRTELWEAYNVGINDRLKQWSVGGVFD